MKLEITETNGKPIFSIFFENMTQFPDALFELCEQLSMPIQRLELRLPTGGDWVGVHGEVK